MNDALATTCTTVYAVCGTAALEPSTRPQLTLIQGGRGAHGGELLMLDVAPARRQAAAQDRPSPKAILAALLIVGALVAAWLVSDLLVSQRRDAAFAGVSTTSLVVAPGECLWDIAEEHGVAGATTDEVVRWIVAENGLGSSSVMAGESLVVPAVG